LGHFRPKSSFLSRGPRAFSLSRAGSPLTWPARKSLFCVPPSLPSPTGGTGGPTRQLLLLPLAGRPQPPLPSTSPQNPAPSRTRARIQRRGHDPLHVLHHFPHSPRENRRRLTPPPPHVGAPLRRPIPPRPVSIPPSRAHKNDPRGLLSHFPNFPQAAAPSPALPTRARCRGARPERGRRKRRHPLGQEAAAFAAREFHVDRERVGVRHAATAVARHAHRVAGREARGLCSGRRCFVGGFGFRLRGRVLRQAQAVVAVAAAVEARRQGAEVLQQHAPAAPAALFLRAVCARLAPRRAPAA